MFLVVAIWFCYSNYIHCKYLLSLMMYLILGLLICTLISENQGLEKSRSVSNLRKISGPTNLHCLTWYFGYFLGHFLASTQRFLPAVAWEILVSPNHTNTNIDIDVRNPAFVWSSYFDENSLGLTFLSKDKKIKCFCSKVFGVDFPLKYIQEYNGYDN